MNEQRCENCKHWLSHGDFEGSCRRYPPQVFMAGSHTGPSQRFPRTQAGEACGEHATTMALRQQYTGPR